MSRNSIWQIFCKNKIKIQRENQNALPYYLKFKCTSSLNLHLILKFTKITVEVQTKFGLKQKMILSLYLLKKIKN
jgi:hypothetical protein